MPGGRLRDWYDTRNPDAPGGDPGNYHTGSGVFWRRIQHVYDLDPDFRKMIGGLKNFRDLLAFNADLACDNTHKVLPEHIRSPDEALTGVTNDLATLVAGVRLLGCG